MVFEVEDYQRIDYIVQTYVVSQRSHQVGDMGSLVTLHSDLDDIRRFAPQNYRSLRRHLLQAATVLHKKLESDFKSLESLADECEFQGHFEQVEQSAKSVLDKYNTLKSISETETKELETYSVFLAEMQLLDADLEKARQAYSGVQENERIPFINDIRLGLLAYYDKALPNNKKNSRLYTNNSLFIRRDAFEYDLDNIPKNASGSRQPPVLSRHSDNYSIYIVEQHLNGAYGGTFDERLAHAADAARGIRPDNQEDLFHIDRIIQSLERIPAEESQKKKVIKELKLSMRRF